MARVTNAEKIIAFLKDNGIDVLRFPWIIEKKKWQKSGTLVINENYLTHDEQVKLHFIHYTPRPDGLWEWNPDCPIEVHDIRDHFEWHINVKRIYWKGK